MVSVELPAVEGKVYGRREIKVKERVIEFQAKFLHLLALLPQSHSVFA